MSSRASIMALPLFEPGTPVVALPSWKAPRLLVPADSAPARWEASAFYPAHLAHARLFRWGLRCVAAAGMLPVRRAPETSISLLRRLRTVWPDADRMAVQLGAPGAAQMWTAEVRSSGGRVLGYVKGGSSPEAISRLHAELAVLPHVPPGRGPVVPWHGALGGAFLLVTEPLRGRPLYPRLSPPSGLTSFVDSLSSGARRSLETHPWVTDLPQHPALEAALEVLADRCWPVVLQHGDCAPWNLHDTDDGLAAFDWEFGNPSAFPHLDEAYYVLQVAYHVLDWTPRRASRAAVRYLGRRDLDPRQADAIVQLAAFDAWRKAISLLAMPRLQDWRRHIWDRPVTSATFTPARRPPAAGGATLRQVPPHHALADEPSCRVGDLHPQIGAPSVRGSAQASPAVLAQHVGGQH